MMVKLRVNETWMGTYEDDELLNSLIADIKAISAPWMTARKITTSSLCLGWTTNGQMGGKEDLEFDTCDDEDSHDAEGYCPKDCGETIMWPGDLESQEMLATV